MNRIFRLSLSTAVALFLSISLYSCKSSTVDTEEKLAAPLLLSPPTEEVLVSDTMRFVWSSVKNATSYELQLSETEAFASTSLDSTFTDTIAIVRSIEPASDHFWRVRARTTSSNGAWSEVRKLAANDLITVAPRVGSSFVVDFGALDTLGNFSRVRSTTVVVSGQHQSFKGKSDVETFDVLVDGNIVNNIGYVYRSDGDLEIIHGYHWIVLPIVSGFGYLKQLPDTVIDGYRYHTAVTVSIPEAGSMTIQGKQFAMERVTVYSEQEVTLSNGQLFDRRKGYSNYYFAPRLGFMANIENGPTIDRPNSRNILTSFTLK